MPRAGRVTLHVLPPNADVRWKARAACAPRPGSLPDLFFPPWGESTRAAKLVCRGCPVVKACLRYALAADEDHGVWGGLSAHERRRLKRRTAALTTPP